MPRGKKSPVKRKTRKTSPRRKVSPGRVKRKTSPRRVKRKTSPRRVKRKTSPRRKTYRKRLNPPTEFDTNRELMERLDADREEVRQNRKRVGERREEIERERIEKIKRDMVTTQERPSAENIKKANRLLGKTDVSSSKFPEYFIQHYGKCIRDFQNKNHKYLNDKIPERDLRDALIESCGLDEKIFNDAEWSIWNWSSHEPWRTDGWVEEWDWRKYNWIQPRYLL